MPNNRKTKNNTNTKNFWNLSRKLNLLQTMQKSESDFRYDLSFIH